MASELHGPYDGRGSTMLTDPLRFDAQQNHRTPALC